MHIAAAKSVDALVLGAFGCGAFENDPNVVARAFKEAADSYMRYVQLIEFAIYCRTEETENYDVFVREIGHMIPGTGM